MRESLVSIRHLPQKIFPGEDQASQVSLIMTRRVKYVGIDAGRTSVKMAFRDDAGHICRTRIPADLCAVNWAENASVMRALELWCEEATCCLAEGVTVVLGAAGAAEYERIWQENAAPSGTGPLTGRIELLGDVSLAAISCNIEETGIVIVYGTGGALMVCDNGSRHICSSYGPIVGDLWGGVALGRAAVRQLLDCWDRKTTLSEYESILSTSLGIRNRKEYLDWVHTAANPYGDLAKLGQKTVECAAGEQNSARQICVRTLKSIVSVVREVNQRYVLPSPLPIVLQGSVLEKSVWMRRQLYRLLERDGIRCEFLLPQKPLEVYALERAESLE